MRNLYDDLLWLSSGQRTKDLSDDFLARKKLSTRKEFVNRACDFAYGITFVESTIAREWLERAIEAEAKEDKE